MRKIVLLAAMSMVAVLVLAPTALAQGVTINEGDTVFVERNPNPQSFEEQQDQFEVFEVVDTFNRDGMQVIVNPAGEEVIVESVRIGNSEKLVTPAAPEAGPGEEQYEDGMQPPATDGGMTNLPDTGGPALLPLAGLMLLAGGVLGYVRRRRA